MSKDLEAKKNERLETIKQIDTRSQELYNNVEEINRELSELAESRAQNIGAIQLLDELLETKK